MYVCLFDIDGTLLASGGAGKHAMYTAIRSEFCPDHVHDGVPFAGRTDRAIVRDLFQLHAIENSTENWGRFLRAYLGHLPGCLAERQGHVLPGVSELLSCLARRDDVALGLLTGNVRDGAQVKLGFYGLFDYFRFGGFGDSHMNRDDVAREALVDVRRHLGESVRLDQVWVIGDTPLDVRCARAIGVRVLAVATGQHTVDQLAAEAPDLLLEDLSVASTLHQQLGAS